MKRLAAISTAMLVCLAGAASAQVRYQPYAAPYAGPAAPTPYGYPVPGGFLQPDETLGTSPSYVIGTNPYAPVVGVVRRCQYPDGWNATDFTRDVNGVPNGIEHTCPAPRGVRARY